MLKDYIGFRPQQGLTIMNAEKKKTIIDILDKTVFPSPTGVNYYESVGNKMHGKSQFSFRPQQGLTIMNSY